MRPPCHGFCGRVGSLTYVDERSASASRNRSRPLPLLRIQRRRFRACLRAGCCHRPASCDGVLGNGARRRPGFEYAADRGPIQSRRAGHPQSGCARRRLAGARTALHCDHGVAIPRDICELVRRRSSVSSRYAGFREILARRKCRALSGRSPCRARRLGIGSMGFSPTKNHAKR